MPMSCRTDETVLIISHLTFKAAG